MSQKNFAAELQEKVALFEQEMLQEKLALFQQEITRTKRHSYKYRGKTYPGVTNILSVINKPALNRWIAKVEREANIKAAWKLYRGFQFDTEEEFTDHFLDESTRFYEHEKQSRKAADLGTECHALIEHGIRHQMDLESTFPEVSEEAIQITDTFWHWWDDQELTPVAVEQKLINTVVGYGGTADLIALRGPDLFVFDWKTSKDVYPEQILQSAAYRAALLRMTGLSSIGAVVKLPKHQDRVEVFTDRSQDAVQPFMFALKLQNWLKEQSRGRK